MNGVQGLNHFWWQIQNSMIWGQKVKDRFCGCGKRRKNVRIQEIWQYKKVTICAYGKEIKVIASSRRGFQANWFFTVLKFINTWLVRYSISISEIFDFPFRFFFPMLGRLTWKIPFVVDQALHKKVTAWKDCTA